MEDLTKSWSCLTLSDVEGLNLRLTEEEAVTEYVLEAKFLTKRALNIEAIAKTFSPIWRETMWCYLRLIPRLKWRKYLQQNHGVLTNTTV